jgi:hypothetical protein
MLHEFLYFLIFFSLASQSKAGRWDDRSWVAWGESFRKLLPLSSENEIVAAGALTGPSMHLLILRG